MRAPRKTADVVPFARKAADAFAAARDLFKSRRRQQVQARDIFKPAEFPPTVRAGHPGLAQDQDLTTITNWGGSSMLTSAMIGRMHEGLAFAGYPRLAELSQRPEYRKMSEVIAEEMTRKWIRIKSRGDDDAGVKQQKVQQIEEKLRALKVREAFRAVAEYDGLLGGGHLWLEIDNGTESGDELQKNIGNGRDGASRAKVSPQVPLTGVKPIEPMWCYPLHYNASNPLSPHWYKPQTWGVMGTLVHRSRLLTIVSREVPDILKPAYGFRGLSLSQMAMPYVDNYVTTRQSVSDLVSNFSTVGIKTNVFAATMAGGQQLVERADLYNETRNNHGLMLIDKEGEEFFIAAVPLGGLDSLQAQSQEHMAAVAGEPLVKFLGIQPAGLNASSDGEIRVFYDGIHARQERVFRDPLQTVIDLIQLSIDGVVDPEIEFDFVPLYQLTDLELGQLQASRADTHAKYIADGVVGADEVRKELAADTDSPYSSLDLSGPPPAPPGMPSPNDLARMGMQPGGPQDGGEQGGGPGAVVPFGEAADAARDEAWNPEQHPRGQPENAGEFANKGQGTTGGGGEKHAGSLYAAATHGEPGFEAVRASLPQTTRDALAEAEQRVGRGVPTDAPVEHGGFVRPDGSYTPEREKVHQSILEQVFTPEAVKAAKPAAGQRPTFTILGGRGGSGKSWFTGPDGPVDAEHAILLDDDRLMAMLPGYEGWNAPLMHREASHVFNLADAIARNLGLNVIHDTTMHNMSSARQYVEAYRGRGYKTAGHYMFLPPHEAARRAAERYVTQGRFVPMQYVHSSRTNEATFDTLKGDGAFDTWTVYDNSAGSGAPRRVAGS